MNPLLYTGREFDAESGLYYYRARYYDPAIGRFLSEDPIGFDEGGVNLYLYASNNPVRYVDYFGTNPAVACLVNPACTTFVVNLCRAAVVGIAVAIGVGVATINKCNDNGDSDCDDDGDDHCEERYRQDTQTCNAITKIRGPSAGARCHASAAARYAACLRNQPLPPLDTWNN